VTLLHANASAFQVGATKPIKSTELKKQARRILYGGLVLFVPLLLTFLLQHLRALPAPSDDTNMFLIPLYNLHK